MTDAVLALLQFGDGLFPAGGFAHSLGLETYAQERRVTDAAGLQALVVAHLEACAGPADAPAAALAAARAAAGDVEGCVAVDARLDAMKCVPEFRAASRQMGRQTLRVAAALGDDAVLAALARAVESGRAPGHHPVAFGAAVGRAGAGPEQAAAALLYSTAALLTGAGLRLLALGQLDAQRVLAAVRPRIARLAAAAARATTADDLWSFAPGLELAGLRHASLEARLFRS
ncbi:MAG TPA: urease accessory UreF family protein [Methylomirabilota bacterium]|nr:urease accessory UreF family protein [Methylomirabilota bacterium]